MASVCHLTTSLCQLASRSASGRRFGREGGAGQPANWEVYFLDRGRDAVADQRVPERREAACGAPQQVR